VGLLNKRLMMFQSRIEETLDNLMAEVMEQWIEADVWTEWTRIRGTSEGFSAYLRREKMIGGAWQAPRNILIGRPEVIVADITATEAAERMAEE
jgi:hypothetical protein